MMKTLAALFVSLLTLTWANSAQPLSIKDFTAICNSAPMSCDEVPIMQAYIGGALDLVATLDEKTDYLETIYCEDKSDLLKTKPIIQYVLDHEDEDSGRNAMVLVIQYLVEKGGC